MTARHKINLGLGISSALALALIQVFASGESWAPLADGILGGFLLGLLTPGSPVGRALDALTGAPSAEAADAVADALRSRPGSVSGRRRGSAALDLLAALVCAGIGAAILAARGL